jgi:hypothetical protein
MNSDGGNLVSKAAFVALDTRVILAALLGWSLVSKVLKRWNDNRTEEEQQAVFTADYSRTPHASSILETEVKSLRKSLRNLRADNLVLAAQVAQLHGGMIGGHDTSSQQSAGPKALNDAFEAAAAAAATRAEPSSSDTNTRLLNESQEIKTLERILDTRNNDENKRDAAEVLLLQQENERLRIALEHLRLENEEMAERMLEVAFRGTADVPTDDEPLEINDLNQLGELRNALISEAGGVLETEEEEEVVLLPEIKSKAGEIGDYTPKDNISSGPTTPELAHEFGEASGSHQRRHISAAAYLED